MFQRLHTSCFCCAQVLFWLEVLLMSATAFASLDARCDASLASRQSRMSAPACARSARLLLAPLCNGPLALAVRRAGTQWLASWFGVERCGGGPRAGVQQFVSRGAVAALVRVCGSEQQSEAVVACGCIDGGGAGGGADSVASAGGDGSDGLGCGSDGCGCGSDGFDCGSDGGCAVAARLSQLTRTQAPVAAENTKTLVSKP
eukprot:354187-Chlamydomonas_euryale.AAC.2